MLDIERFVYSNFDDVKLYGNPPTDYQVNCFQCDDTKGHLNISISKMVVHCFKCGYSASWVGFVMDVTGLSHYNALSELYKKPRMVDFHDKIAEAHRMSDMAEKSLVQSNLPEGFMPLFKADESYRYYKNYLINRGFDEQFWFMYNLGVSPNYEGRIIIPIEHGYWQGRSIWKWVQPKYINPKSEARSVIFNSQALDLYSEVVICEGAFSSMAVGFNSIALIGKEIPEEKSRRLINSNVERFIIALEPDAWGTTKELADVLHRNGKQITIWRYSQGDPADPNGKFEEMEYNSRTSAMLSMNM